MLCRRRRLQSLSPARLGLGPRQNARDRSVVERRQGLCRLAVAKDGKGLPAVERGRARICHRAGTTTPYWWGTGISREQANYRYEGFIPFSKQRTHPVDSYKPNPWGHIRCTAMSTIGSRIAGTTAIGEPRSTDQPGPPATVFAMSCAAAALTIFPEAFTRLRAVGRARQPGA